MVHWFFRVPFINQITSPTSNELRSSCVIICKQKLASTTLKNFVCGGIMIPQYYIPVVYITHTVITDENWYTEKWQSVKQKVKEVELSIIMS